MSRLYPALFAVLLGVVLALALAVPYVARCWGRSRRGCFGWCPARSTSIPACRVR